MEVAERRGHAMASEVQVVVVGGGREHLDRADEWIARYEELWSRFRASSDVSRLNRSRGLATDVDPATIRLVEYMVEGHLLTDGRFDPTTLSCLMSAGYTTGVDADGRVRPHPSATPGTVATGAMRRVSIDAVGHRVTLPSGSMLDAGGIGKGLAADLVVARLIATGAAGALVDIGGDLAAAGTAPEPCGWRVAVEHPVDDSRSLTEFTVAGGGVATSSTLSRRWTVDDVPMHHTIDSESGRPASTDLAAATVIAPCGWLAEVHATAVLLGGRDGVAAYAARHDVDVVAVTVGDEVVATRSMEGLVRS